MSGRSGTLAAMAKELQSVTTARRRAGSSASSSTLPASAARASEVAARQRSPETRRTYATVYRTFCAFLEPERWNRAPDARDGPRLP